MDQLPSPANKLTAVGGVLSQVKSNAAYIPKEHNSTHSLALALLRDSTAVTCSFPELHAGSNTISTLDTFLSCFHPCDLVSFLPAAPG